MRTVYFDYNATTPLDPQVREAMLPVLGRDLGQSFRACIMSDGRRGPFWMMRATAPRKVLGCKPSEVIFTSGGTESTIWRSSAPRGCSSPRAGTSSPRSIEHHAVLHCLRISGKERRLRSDLPAGGRGRASVSPDSLEKALRPDTILVSIMAANNEIGTIQPVAELGAICRERGRSVPYGCRPMVRQGTVPKHPPVQRGSGFDLRAQVSRAERRRRVVRQIAIAARSHSVWRRPRKRAPRRERKIWRQLLGWSKALERFVHTPVFSEGQLGSADATG